MRLVLQLCNGLRQQTQGTRGTLGTTETRRFVAIERANGRLTRVNQGLGMRKPRVLRIQVIPFVQGGGQFVELAYLPRQALLLTA